MNLPPFNLATAQQYYAAGHISDWLHTYLKSGEWANIGLSDGLKKQPRLWTPPLLLPLSEMERVCGCEPSMEYVMPPDVWEKRVTRIMDSFTALEDFPPLVLYHEESGRMTIRDGNHRHEAMTRLQIPACYVLIWFDNANTHRMSRFSRFNVAVT